MNSHFEITPLTPLARGQLRPELIETDDDSDDSDSADDEEYEGFKRRLIGTEDDGDETSQATDSPTGKLILTSPDHLENLRKNNNILRSHNLSTAVQNRQLREQIARLRRKHEEEETKLRDEVKGLQGENARLVTDVARLTYQKAVLEECSIEWARLEAVHKAELRELRRRHVALGKKPVEG